MVGSHYRVILVCARFSLLAINQDQGGMGAKHNANPKKKLKKVLKRAPAEVKKMRRLVVMYVPVSAEAPVLLGVAVLGKVRHLPPRPLRRPGVAQTPLFPLSSHIDSSRSNDADIFEIGS